MESIDSWITHCKEKYPREFATPERLKSPVNNADQLSKLVMAYTPSHNIYVTAYSFSEWTRLEKTGKLDYSKAILDLIFIDLDWKINPEIALYEARLLDLSCRHRNITPRIYFSGQKGFAIYLDFEPVNIQDEYKKPVIRTFIEYIQNRLSLKTLDRQCMDGISRISRLPNTLHHTSGLFCIPLSRDQLWHMDGIKYILELAKNQSDTPITIYNNQNIPKMLYKIQDILIDQPIDIQKAKAPVPLLKVPIQRNITDSKGTLCPGVMEIISGVQEGVRDVSLCGLTAGLNLQLQMNFDDIMQAVLTWSDQCVPALSYDLFTLNNKIAEIINKQYRPCTFLIKAGVRACDRCSIKK